ncbi:MAG: PAS domain S-box protein [Opitutus sp.]|nr:PAS domain S-box protein [Opitutus sp.]
MSDAPPLPSPTAVAESLDSAILRLLMETVPDRIYFKDLKSRFVRVNRAHAAWLDAASPEAVAGKSDADFFSPQHARKALAEEQDIIRTGEPMVGEVQRITKRDGSLTWGSTTKMPWRDHRGRIIGTFGLTRDVTATKDAEEKLVEERNLLRTIIDHLPSRLYVKDKASRYVLNSMAHLQQLGVATQAEALGHTVMDFFPGERGQQALADDRQVFDSGKPILNQEKSDFGAEGRVRWSLVTKVPLRDVRGQLVGLVGISHDITRRKLAEEEIRRRSAEMETDLRMARQVQEAFLNRPYPTFPRSATVEASALRFAHRYLPTTTLGGDFYGILQLSDTKCGVLICDVMGHGVRAGLLTALIRGVVEEIGARAVDPAYVVAEVNHSLMPIVEETGQPVFATVFFAVIDLAAQTLTYTNAGHPPPVVLQAKSTEILRLAPANPEPAAGLLTDFPYTHHECEFHPGDLFLGYTDGIFEATDPHGHMFGEQRLDATLAECRGLSCAQLVERLVQSVKDFSYRSAFEDDVCLVAIESAGPRNR